MSKQDDALAAIHAAYIEAVESLERNALSTLLAAIGNALEPVTDSEGNLIASEPDDSEKKERRCVID